MIDKIIDTLMNVNKNIANPMRKIVNFNISFLFFNIFLFSELNNFLRYNTNPIINVAK